MVEFATAGGPGVMEGGSNYRFGPFELRTGARQLSKGGTKVKLSGQPYLILEVLLSRAGEIVTREELRQKLWPADTFVDFEHGLNTSVKKLRQALCDSAETPRYIETAPRLGYRFIATVEVLPEKKPQSLVEAEPAASLSPVVVSDNLPRNEVKSEGCRVRVRRRPAFWCSLVHTINGPTEAVANFVECRPGYQS